MGYNMSKPALDPSMCDIGTIDDGISPRKRHNECVDVNHEIFHLSRLRSEPSESTLMGLGGGRRMPISTVKMLFGREANCSGRGRFSSADRSHVLGQYLPVNGPWPVDQMGTRAYVSQFSSDGSLFIAAFQGRRIRIYNVDNGWKVQKDIIARNMLLTITDTSLSPDRRFLVYASMTPLLHIVNVGSSVTESYASVTDVHDCLDIIPDDDWLDAYCVFSVKFSPDGRELVAGANNNSMCLYDLERNIASPRIQAHTSDVNTVTFADETGNLIYSGSDDNLCKVWDRRCYITKGKAAGGLTGHLEGITCIDSRGDGRYLISNGKDQTTKLWDIRKMSASPKSFRSPNRDWDYRSMEYPAEAKQTKHPYDQSLATYRGHSVLRTLIRCYFSPTYSTGQRYIYTGSHDNSV